MRVVGGAWRGRPLRAPAGRGTRPTSDRVREAVFDVLGALPEAEDVVVPSQSGSSRTGALAGHAVLDVFAGSGALGIEALSRGAVACTFVDSAPAAVRALRGNLERLGVPIGAAAAPVATGEAGVGPRAVVLGRDVHRALAADACRGARYTLVFADPPYEAYQEVRPALARLLQRVIVPGAVVVVETAAGTAAGMPWDVVREKRYGDTRVTFLVNQGREAAEGESAG